MKKAKPAVDDSRGATLAVAARGLRAGKGRSEAHFEFAAACAHIPGWFMLGTLTAASVVYIFAFGVIMAIILRYSRSLWAPIVAHSLNDGLSNVIFHI